MKKLFVAFAVFVCVAAFSCKKVSGPANGHSVQQNNNRDSTVSLTAVINGVPWKTDSAIAYYEVFSGNDSGVVNLVISASNKDIGKVPTFMTFTITNYTGPNTYTILPPANTAAYYINNFRHFASTGQVVILSDSAYALKGTFSFTADTLTVTSGVFNAANP